MRQQCRGASVASTWPNRFHFSHVSHMQFTFEGLLPVFTYIKLLGLLSYLCC